MMNVFEHRNRSIQVKFVKRGQTYIIKTSETKVCKLDLPAVVDKNVGALDITVQEVFAVAVAKTIEQLFHDGRIELLRKLNKTGVEQPHEVVVHKLEDQVKRALLLPETKTRQCDA